MQVEQVRAVYFSATGTTRRVVKQIAETIAERLGVGWVIDDFTSPQVRQSPLCFAAHDLVIFGVPTYAGRVPNLLLPFLRTIEGNGALAVPVALFGNRNFDNSLIELRDLLENGGCHTIAGAACVGQHAFSQTLGKDRPDAQDQAEISRFIDALEKRLQGEVPQEPIAVDGIPGLDYGGYYQPRDRKGVSIDIRKVKPKTNAACTRCGSCAELCPMGSISFEDYSQVPGICIKCGACVKYCPVHAKYYDDAGYLYHKTELEEGYKRRADNHFYI